MSKRDDPNTAPTPDRWYPLTLGPTFKDPPQPNQQQQPPSSRFCTLRYDFKPASLDTSQPGTLNKTKDNKINVEFNNNQPGKPKWSFEGVSEDYKENDAVLLFDGRGFRLERLHRSVKRLRHVRLPGESSNAGSAAAVSLDPSSPPVGRAGVGSAQGKGQVNRGAAGGGFTPPQHQQMVALPPPPPLPLPVSVEVERIDIGDDGGSSARLWQSTAEENTNQEKPVNSPPQEDPTASPDDFDLEQHLEMLNEDDDDDAVGPDNNATEENIFSTGIDINLPHQHDTDDEIADVDVNDDNGVMAGNAAAALRAQVHKEETQEQTSSSSTSSGSESSSSSSGSGSGSSSSDSESSDGDSVNSV